MRQSEMTPAEKKAFWRAAGLKAAATRKRNALKKKQAEAVVLEVPAVAKIKKVKKSKRDVFDSAASATIKIIEDYKRTKKALKNKINKERLILERRIEKAKTLHEDKVRSHKQTYQQIDQALQTTLLGLLAQEKALRLTQPDRSLLPDDLRCLVKTSTTKALEIRTPLPKLFDPFDSYDRKALMSVLKEGKINSLTLKQSIYIALMNSPYSNLSVSQITDRLNFLKRENISGSGVRAATKALHKENKIIQVCSNPIRYATPERYLAMQQK